MKELNSLESRRGRRPLDVNNVIYWFKNTRAAVKRAEMKARSSSAGPGSSSDPTKPQLSAAGAPPNFWTWFGNPNNSSTSNPFSILPSSVGTKRSESSEGSTKDDNDVVIEDNESSIMTSGENNNTQELENNAYSSDEGKQRPTPPPSMVAPYPQMMNYMSYIGPLFQVKLRINVLYTDSNFYFLLCKLN